MSWNLGHGASNYDVDRSAGAYKEECPECQIIFWAHDLTQEGLCHRCERKLEKEKEADEEYKRTGKLQDE